MRKLLPLKAIKTILIGDVIVGLFVLAIAGIAYARVNTDVKLPLDAVVTALVTNYAYNHLPDLDTAPKEDYLDPQERGAMYWGFQTNSDWLARRTIQLIPYYSDVGIVGQSVYPSVVVFEPQNDMDSFHLGGYTMCQLGVVALNIRYANSGDAWGHSSGALGTLAHEFTHLEGDCGDSADVEPTAQVGMVEVLAALIDDGDRTAIRPFMYELRGLAMGYLKWWANKNNVRPEYDFFENYIIRSAYDDQARMFGYSRDIPATWQSTMDLYNATPFYYIWEALQTQGTDTRYLPFGINQNELRLVCKGAVCGKVNASILKSIKLSDVKFVLDHIREVIAEGNK